MNLSAHPVFVSLTPVFLLIALGYFAGRRDWIRESAVRDLSNLVFLLLIPALLFRTMSGVHVETLDLRPLAAYFPAALLAIGAWLLTFYLTRTSSLAALIATPLTLPLLAWQEPEALLPMSALTLLIVWRHRGNLRDLFAGRERHF
mgnify:CR=1 FL=1